MRKVKERLNMKMDTNGKLLIGVLVFLVLIFFNTCGSNTASLDKKVEEQSKRIDSLEMALEERPSEREMLKAIELRSKIDGLSTSKRTLYDWNAVVRRAVRPDDRMNEYDERIRKLEGKYDSLDFRN